MFFPSKIHKTESSVILVPETFIGCQPETKSGDSEVENIYLDLVLKELKERGVLVA